MTSGYTNDNNYSTLIAPYINVNPTLTPANLASGIVFNFRKGRFARENNYSYADGYLNGMGDWVSNATGVTIKGGQLYYQDSAYIPKYIDLFNSFVGAQTYTRVSIPNGGYNTPLTYTNILLEGIIDNVLYTNLTLFDITGDCARYSLPASTSTAYRNAIPDTLRVTMINDYQGHYYSPDNAEAYVSCGSNYNIHTEFQPTSGYIWVHQYGRIGNARTGTVTVNDGLSTTNFNFNGGLVAYSGTTSNLTLGTKYDFNLLGDEGAPFIVELGYQYQINYAF
jgi:hypothetical protein